ncbi:hypothetical protein GB937_009104 [Aspergillus fischeri]|nr:hypothetical protein GB937_009104 [Aspergillus fischeri]
MEARGYSWSDEVKKNYLDGALSYEVEGALIGVRKEETFADYCRQVHHATYVPAPLANPALAVTNPNDAMD